MPLSLVTTKEQLELYLVNLHAECKEANAKEAGEPIPDEDRTIEDCDLLAIAKPLADSDIFAASCHHWISGEHPLIQMAGSIATEEMKILFLHIFSSGIKVGYLIAHPEQAVIETSREEVLEVINNIREAAKVDKE